MSESTDVPAFIEARRSIRAFTAEPVAARACSTGSSRPRASRRRRTTRGRGAGCVVDTPDAQARRSPTAWARAGATDLAADGVDRRPHRRARRRVARASSPARPALVLGCLTWDGLDRYPDEARQRAEWGMALLSLGAAVENLMLARDRRRASRRAGSPRRSSAPRRRATRSPSPTGGSRTRSCSSATPTRATTPRPTRPTCRSTAAHASR